ncbi:MAG TPA: twin-arginine translocase TatA/TatE family subunit [Desulfobacterales bacterium]
MFGIGMPEMLLILAIALIVIGPKKLPDLAKSLGKALREFKQATSELKESIDLDSDLKKVRESFDDIRGDARGSAGSDSGKTEPTPPAAAGEGPSASGEEASSEDTTDRGSPPDDRNEKTDREGSPRHG